MHYVRTVDPIEWGLQYAHRSQSVSIKKESLPDNSTTKTPTNLISLVACELELQKHSFTMTVPTKNVHYPGGRDRMMCVL